MFGQLKEAQEKMEAAKKRLDEIFVLGEAGSGAVKVHVSASKKVKSIHISDEIIADKEQIEDLVTIAINRAMENAEKVAEAEMQSIAREMMPSMGGLSNLFGKK
jgi:DNA-binding YbaB/EbfC family protein